ncbi:type IV pilus modification protein PilV [Paracidovorax anthurii]|uniref:Type IV pilus assembly protein PilV n=1 Tax=Paracidovorax anthurii TaxID=78229 RepID=A0A328Z005_9BURK|nr:type IV pilus modification protein PilV [Paracidovorax anthurii]RAR76167.1 type IV pilus assembly protein PilV [Paracidovorax anthurii]
MAHHLTLQASLEEQSQTRQLQGKRGVGPVPLRGGSTARRGTGARPPFPLRVALAERGLSLVEVLVSIVVLSVGMLGAVSLQATSLQASREARLQASAARYGQELAELMRSNKNTAIKLAATDNPYLYDSTSTTLANPNCGYPGSSDACASAISGSSSDEHVSISVAQRDMYEWVQRISAELPGARILLCQDSNPYDADGRPVWACNNTGGTIVLKIGWTRGNTLRGATGMDATSTAGINTGAFDRALRPAVVFPVVAGSAS